MRVTASSGRKESSPQTQAGSSKPWVSRGNPNGCRQNRGSLTRSPCKYAGMEFDTTTALYFSRARYYDSTVGRWINEDPTQFAGGDPNLYRYVHNAPTVATDPSGQLWWVLIGGLAGGVIDGGIVWMQGGSGLDIAYGFGRGFVVGSVSVGTFGAAGSAAGGLGYGGTIAAGGVSGFTG